MYRHFASICILLMAQAAHAVNWGAHITNPNTPVTDADIQITLSQGMSPNFAATFPGRLYGISVLLDTQPLPQLPGDLVYLALQLSHRLSNGALELPVGRYSEVIVQPPGSSQEARREAVVQKLSAMAGSFSRAMIQNKPAFDHAKSSVPPPSGNWQDWPDYHPSSAGKPGGGP